jgi:L-lactate dehydrogenase complex protein LldG
VRSFLESLAQSFSGAALGRTLPLDLRPPLPELPPEEAPLGVSYALFAVAETGSVALSSEEGRKVHLLPPTHLVFVEADRVFGTLLEGLLSLEALPTALGLHSAPPRAPTSAR